MPLTKIQIGNLALGHLGQTQLIDDLTEDTTEAAVLAQFYDVALELTLAGADWYFARKRVTLAVVAGTPPPEWKFQYGWPADCLKPRRIADGLRVRSRDERTPFAVENNGTVRIILCDVGAPDDIILVYTGNVVDTTLWSPEFGDALSWKLAYYMAMPLANSAKLRDSALSTWQFKLQEAVAESFESEQADVPLDSEGIRSRY